MLWVICILMCTNSKLNKMKTKVIHTVLSNAEDEVNDFLSTLEKERVFNVTYLGSPSANHHSIVCIVTYYD
jgi:hypothetical protein